MKIIYVRGDDYVALEFEDYLRNEFDGSVSKAMNAWDMGEVDIEKWDFVEHFEYEKEIPVDFIRLIKERVLDYDASKHENIYYEGEII